MSQHKTTALITGASAGIGAEFCRQLAPRCDIIIAVARRVERLETLAEELSDQVEMHCIEADLTSVEGVAATMEALRQKGPVDYLVNNAGYMPYGEFTQLPIDEQRPMLTLHCDTTMTLCRAAVPFMKELGAGVIINVSSVASFLPGKAVTVYGASKQFMSYFSVGLQDEVQSFGIEVQALCPGYTRTEFHDEMVAEGFDRDRIPSEYWMEAKEVVAASLASLGSGKVIVVPGEMNVALARASLEKQLADL